MKQARTFFLCGLLSLTACGTTWQDRAATGGMIGSGAGFAAGALVGGPFTGAAVGLGLGGLAGGLTKPEYIYLGEPFWYDKGYYNKASAPPPEANYVQHPTYKADNSASVRTRQMAAAQQSAANKPLPAVPVTPTTTSAAPPQQTTQPMQMASAASYAAMAPAAGQAPAVTPQPYPSYPAVQPGMQAAPAYYYPYSYYPGYYYPAPQGYAPMPPQGMSAPATMAQAPVYGYYAPPQMMAPQQAMPQAAPAAPAYYYPPTANYQNAAPAAGGSAPRHPAMVKRNYPPMR
jgi:hypothetical protein